MRRLGDARVRGLWIVVVLAACGTPPQGDPWHQAPPEILLRITPLQARSLLLDSARVLPAPLVRFAANLRPDINHMVVVTAPTAGRVTWARPDGLVETGDSLARLTTHAGPITAPSTGRWWRGTADSTTVRAGAVVGAVIPANLALAVGSISQEEAAYMHRGDSVLVRYPAGGPVLTGRIEEVRISGAARWLPVEVSVETPGRTSMLPSTTVEVTVTPNGPRDSVLAVPMGALARLVQGAAVFEPIDSITFRLRWVVVGPADNGLATLQGAARTPYFLATGDLSALITAAQDSLRSMARDELANGVVGPPRGW